MPSSNHFGIRGRLQRAEVGALVNALRYKAVVVGALPDADYSPDPDDNIILATGIAGGAQLIVSGDKGHMLNLGAVEGMPILSAREFVALFDRFLE